MSAFLYRPLAQYFIMRFRPDIVHFQRVAPGQSRTGSAFSHVATPRARPGRQSRGLYMARMEFGPRALGARSIVASPCDATINDSLSRCLDRSGFMPFPYVLEEDAERVRDHVGQLLCNSLHAITCGVRPEWRKRIPAVVHVHGTARAQIVRERDNPSIATILCRFRNVTGVPVLINTSFNVHEESIANRPEECRQALVDGRVDFVVTTGSVCAMKLANDLRPCAAGTTRFSSSVE